MDLHWVLMKVCCYGLQRFGRGKGRFVFAVAVRPKLEMQRLEMAVADTTAIPAGNAVRAMVDKVVEAHIEGARRVPTWTWRALEVGEA